MKKLKLICLSKDLLQTEDLPKFYGGAEVPASCKCVCQF